ncbi:hypothetical protein [Dethiosulfovibrio salsuginis]|uniref:hypothetical protein n=1 Tax=Dethiosulfovibrio salsuginis TaxID=561720 RepID=UPI000A1C8DDF|nr:hypothetical protein [Dethiosulfovibrio salsuginis]
MSYTKYVGVIALLMLLLVPCGSYAENLELTGRISKVERPLRRMELNQGEGIIFPVLWNEETIFLDGKDGAVSPAVFFDLYSSRPIWLSAIDDGENLLAQKIAVSLEIQ